MSVLGCVAQLLLDRVVLGLRTCTCEKKVTQLTFCDIVNYYFVPTKKSKQIQKLLIDSLYCSKTTYFTVYSW